MKRRKANRYTAGFKAAAVKRYQQSGGKSLSESARDVGVSAKSLRKWVVDAGGGPDKRQAKPRVFPVVDGAVPLDRLPATQDLELRIGGWSVRIDQVEG